MKKQDKKQAPHTGRAPKKFSEGEEAERREEVVQHEANYDSKEEDADIEVARKRKAG